MAEIKKQYSLIEFDRSEDYIAYKSFRDVFFSATREQQDFFLNNCLDDKTFSYEARSMMQDIINGKDPRGILPELNLEKSDKQPYAMPPLSAEDRIHEAMLEHMKGWHGHDRALIKGEWAQQGWTLNIAANDMEDYARKCEVLLPELNKMGVSFSIVKPCDFEQYKTGENRNQFITIYGGPNLDFTELSPEAQAILHEPSDGTVHGNMQIDGCLFCRYGAISLRTNNNALITNPNGYLEADWRDPRIAYPSFITFNQDEVLNFYKFAEDRFAETGDYRAYLQEKETMMPAIEGEYAYVAFVIPDENLAKVSSALLMSQPDSASSAFITSHTVPGIDGQPTKEHLLMLHKTDVEQLFGNWQELDVNQFWEKGVSEMIERPLWDVRNCSFIVPADCAETIQMRIAPGTPSEIINLEIDESGVMILNCDQAMVDQMLTVLEQEQIPVIEYNKEFAIEAQSFINDKWTEHDADFFELNDLVESLDLDIDSQDITE